MAQRKNSVQLSGTAIARLQKMVDTGEYCSIDDACNHVVLSNLSGIHQYSPVPTKPEPKTQLEAPKTTTTDSDFKFTEPIPGF